MSRTSCQFGSSRRTHLPQVLAKVDEDERRELPDRFLGTHFADAAAGECAADGKRQRDELAGDQRRDPDEHADRRARVWPGDQPGEKGALERQVGRLVIEQ